MRRRILALTAALVIVSGVMSLAAPMASAQTGYPGQCDVTTGSQNLGTVTVGQSFVGQLSPTCVWTPGSSVSVSVNGQSVGTKTASASGTVSVTIRILSATEFEIDDPVRVSGQCGGNSVVGVGQSSVAGGATVTQSGGFTVSCPASTAQASKGTVAFTGANIAKWAAVAALLVVLGFGIVTLARRRRLA